MNMRSYPLLAVDIASSSVSAILRLADAQGQTVQTGQERQEAQGAQGLFAFRSPAPAKILAERIRQCTALGRSLHLKGSTLDPCLVPPLLAHLKAGLSLDLHPGYAALVSARPEKLEAMGIGISENGPASAISLESRDIVPDHWYRLMESAGLPRPERIFVSASESGYLLDEATHRPPASWLAGLFAARPEQGIPLPELLAPDPEPRMLRLSSIRSITGFCVLDSAIAFVFGMAALPLVAGRSRREGVALLYLGKHFLRAALVYRNRLYALLELPREAGGKEGFILAKRARDGEAGAPPMPGLLMQWLDDLRLGWLPAEKAEEYGGFLCRAENFPPEAEGFRPLFVSGPDAALLAGQGQITDLGQEESANCRGLIAAFGDLPA